MSDEIQFRPKHSTLTFGTDGRPEAYTSFNYDAIDRGNPLESLLVDATKSDKLAELEELFNRLLVWCWITPGGKTRSFRMASERFAAASATLKPFLFDGATFGEIGRMHGVGRANISRLSVEFQQEMGIRLGYQSKRFNSGRVKKW